jgi:hypothetical protein
MAIKLKLISYSFSFWDCGSFAGPGGSGPPAQLQKATSSGLTIDDNVLVLILAFFGLFFIYTVISKNKTPINWSFVFLKCCF